MTNMKRIIRTIIIGILLQYALLSCGVEGNVYDESTSTQLRWNTMEDSRFETVAVYDSLSNEKYLEFPSHAAFFNNYGFENQELFYSFSKQNNFPSLLGEKDAFSSNTGIFELELFYDESNHVGCGIQKDANNQSYGLIFRDVIEENWKAIDYSAPFSVDQINNEIDYNAVEWVSDFKETFELNDKGQLVEYVATSDIVDEEKLYDDVVGYRVFYRYDENGILRYRLYICSNTQLFGSEKQTWEVYFDNMGRVAYENYYITHGWYYAYYIYNNDIELKPDYGLFVDHNLNVKTVDKFVVYN